MKTHEIEARLAGVEFRLAVLERRLGGAQDVSDQGNRLKVDPSIELKVAVEMTLQVLKAWKADKGSMMQDDDYEDYRAVVSTLPMLERTYAQWSGKAINNQAEP